MIAICQFLTSIQYRGLQSIKKNDHINKCVNKNSMWSGPYSMGCLSDDIVSDLMNNRERCEKYWAIMILSSTCLRETLQSDCTTYLTMFTDECKSKNPNPSE